MKTFGRRQPPKSRSYRIQVSGFPITATVTGAPGETQCVVDETPGIEYPIIAKSLTIVYAYCEPL